MALFAVFLLGCWLAGNPFEATKRIASQFVEARGWVGTNEWSIIWSVVLVAMFFEFMDASAGMGFGTAITPLLLLMGFDPKQIVPVVIFGAGLVGTAHEQNYRRLPVAALGNVGDDVYGGGCALHDPRLPRKGLEDCRPGVLLSTGSLHVLQGHTGCHCETRRLIKDKRRSPGKALDGAPADAAAPISPVYERQRMYGRSIMKFRQTPGALYSDGETYRHTYSQQRLFHFGITMIVMGVSFLLYYLGFFGRVEGPLNPAQLGEYLAASGMSKVHLIILVVVLVLLALSWNWIFNLAGFRLGKRLTCSRTEADGACCHAPVKRVKSISKKNRATVSRYVCTEGHKRPEADFHPVKKGTAGHTFCAILLIFGITVWYVA